MSIIEVLFLGTGTSQGVPMIGCACEVCTCGDPKDQRLRSSVYITYKNKHLLIDTSADFRQQMLRYRIARIDAVLYTHEHRDHLGGLDDLRAFNYWQNTRIPAYAQARTLERIRHEFDYAFANPAPASVPQLDLHSIAPDKPFTVQDIQVQPIVGQHFNLSVLGFRIENFAYLTDMNAIDPQNLEKLQHLDTLVINALQQKPHPSHFSLAEALAIIAQLQPKRAFLTHIGHLMGTHAAVSTTLPANVQLAYDGLVLQIPSTFKNVAFFAPLFIVLL